METVFQTNNEANMYIIQLSYTFYYTVVTTNPNKVETV